MKSNATQILYPLINPNEPEMQIASIAVSNGQFVASGDVLCVLETTKATQELLSETDGYVFDLHAQPGDVVSAGDFFCILAPQPDWRPSSSASNDVHAAEQQPEESLPPGLRITQPALTMARELGIDLNLLPTDELITASRIRELVSGKTELSRTDLPLDLPEPVQPNSVLIYGGGGHGKSLIELIRLQGAYSVAGIIDDGKPLGSHILGVPILGGSQHLKALRQHGFQLALNAVGGIGNLASRITVFDRLAEAGFSFPTVIHPTAFVEASAQLGAGVQVFPHAYVGSDVKIGFGVIVNTSAVVSHDCVLGDYVNLSPGSILAGEVKIGEKTLIGMGVTVNLQVRIGARCRVGNGATIKQDVPDNTIIRAGAVWPS
ncbi:MAG: NeuD/PglB/VioB family sugar acetyltransferase [Chloroflexota bacterium]